MAIPNDKFVMVTGDPRSGTSLMMQTLKLLGVPIAGHEFVGDARFERRRDFALSELEQRREDLTLQQYNDKKAAIEQELASHKQRIRNMNPGGFWELPGFVLRGIPDHAIDVVAGKAVKVVSSGAFPHVRRNQAIGTNPDLVHRYILCARDPRHVAQSQTGLTSSVNVSTPDEWIGPKFAADARRYLIENGQLIKWLSDQGASFRSLWLSVDLDEFVSDPAGTVAAIATHLGISPRQAQIDAAVANVDPSLRRSPDDFKAWIPGRAIDGMAAENIHTAMKSLDPTDFTAAVATYDTRSDIIRRENARWYDDTIGMMVNTELDDEIRRNRTLRLKVKTTYKRDLLKGLQPQTEQSFSEPADAPQYTIDRPIDKTPLTRKMVSYQGELLTWEAAYVRHQRQWARLQVNRIALNERQALAAKVVMI